MIPTIAQQVEEYRRCHIVGKPTVKELSPHNKGKPGGSERAERRHVIYELMGDGEIWTVFKFKEKMSGTTREICSALKVLIQNELVEIVGRDKIRGVKICYYRRKGL